MLNRWILAGLTAALLSTAGCSAGTVEASAPPPAPSQRSDAECSQLVQQRVAEAVRANPTDPAISGTAGDMLRQVGGCDDMARRYDAAMCASNAQMDYDGDCIVTQDEGQRYAAEQQSPSGAPNPGGMTEAECVDYVNGSSLPNAELVPKLRSIGCAGTADDLAAADAGPLPVGDPTVTDGDPRNERD